MDETMSSSDDSFKSPQEEYIDNDQVSDLVSIERKALSNMYITNNSGSYCSRDVLSYIDNIDNVSIQKMLRKRLMIQHLQMMMRMILQLVAHFILTLRQLKLRLISFRIVTKSSKVNSENFSRKLICSFVKYSFREQLFHLSNYDEVSILGFATGFNLY